MQENNLELNLSFKPDTSSLTRSLDEVSKVGQRFAYVLTNAFEGIIIKGRTLENTLRSLALSLSRLALRSALKPLEQALGSVFDGLFSGFVAFGKGGVPNRALPVPFANGGVIATPHAFPLGDGGLGLMGERGAEAIMPLMRGPDGKLGVRAADPPAPVRISFNVTSPDAASFLRSETQIGAMLSRIVSRGQRNL